MFRRRARYSRVAESAGAHASAAAGDDSYREESSRLLEGGAEREDRSRYASKVSSSLSLQILMYYNVLLSAVYFFLEGGLVINKVSMSTCTCSPCPVCWVQHPRLMDFTQRLFWELDVGAVKRCAVKMPSRSANQVSILWQFRGGFCSPTVEDRD